MGGVIKPLPKLFFYEVYMKKILLLCIMISLVITSCNSYEISMEIEPEISIVGDSISLNYILNDHIINHELYNITLDKIQYIKK